MTFDVIVAARRRTRRLLLAATAVAVVVGVCVAGVALTDQDTRTAAPSTPPSPAAGSAAGAAVVLPADTRWVSVAGVALPVSATAGPLRQHDGLASGFAHTPAGAVLAAVHLLVRTTAQVGSNVFAPTVDRQVVGAHAGLMRAAVAADYRALGGTGGGPVGSLTSALAGVRLAGYTASTARIDLLTVAVDATGTARFATSLIEVAFTGGDWALVAPPNGRWDSVVQPVTAAQAAAYPPLSAGR